MKKFFFTALAFMLMCSMTTMADNAPLWMRYPAISPDGSLIAFSYKGDIYTVSSKGGQARQLTTNNAYDAYPVWSPDGSKIAFASSREGGLDVFCMSKDGGTPIRLTTNSSDEVPVAFKDNETILFQSNLRPTANSIIFASREFPQIYEAKLSGGRPKLFSALTMCDISINANGDILYHDQKGYEDQWRKHHTSSITRDIWMLSNGQHRKLTNYKGEDRTPRWASDGRSFYYLSEQDGTFNIYKNADGKTTQITSHKQNPVRYLTVASNSLICYSFDGEIYTVTEGQQPSKVNISITTDRQDKELIRQQLTRGARNISVSPSGKEVAFVVHGDIYVTSTDYKTTRRITNTPEQERTISFSPDGRSLVYDSERNGLWQIFTATIKNKDEKQFAYATDIVEEQLTKNSSVCLQPEYSPDGKMVAYLQDRGALCVVDVKTKNERIVMDGKYNFSYSDGDEWFQWSPDSKYLLSSYIGTGGWNNVDIALVPADGSQKIVNITESGYNESNGKWALGGKAMLFESDRAGYRSHGSWGAESDYYLMFFDEEAYENYRQTKEEKELRAQALKEQKKEAAKEPAKGKGKKDNKTVEAKPAFVLDLENCRDRVVRLTGNSSHLGDAVLSVTGDTIYYQSRFEDGFDLWRHDLREEKTEKVLKGVSGAMYLDKDLKNIFVAGGKGIQKIEFASAKAKPIDYEADFNYRPYEEREYIFNHIWKQVKDKFYVEDIHGVDWQGYYDTYAKFLPHINNNYDFSIMLSEMLGELNGSHTGCRYRPASSALSTASLGVFYDESYEGKGLRIDEVIPRSPLALKHKMAGHGTIIEAIDGIEITAGMDINPLLDGKAGKRVRLSLRNADGRLTDVVIKPISQGAEQTLLYKRWVDRNRHIVDSLSNGQLAYVHVKAMDSESFRTVYRELLSDKNRNRKAVIVDERHNGGGWLHDDLCTLLSGKEYQQFVPHGKYVGSDPFNKWNKPSCVLVCEDDYSNGHGFPWVYKTLGIGKLIGTPVPGTMTAVWWETLIDSSLVFGIPQVGCRSMDGVYGENTQLYPDITVYNTPEDYLSGHDTQLEQAVKTMMLGF